MKGIIKLLKLIDWFVPISVTDDLSAADVDLLFRTRVTVGFCLILSVMVSLMFFSRILIEGVITNTLWILIVAAAILSLLPFCTRWAGSYKFAAYFVIVIGLIVIPIRAWSTGGIDSIVMSWFALVPLVAWLTMGGVNALFITLFCLVEAFLIAHPELIGMRTTIVSEASSTMKFITLAVLVLLIAILMLVYEVERREQLIRLDKKLSEIKVLSGLLRICAACKKIHDTDNNWKQMESYIDTHSEAQFSHGLCPECASSAYEEAGISKPTKN